MVNHAHEGTMLLNNYTSIFYITPIIINLVKETAVT